ncbi:hypothetical protein MSG28_004564 [Choristoneura fumiferana]|uniref:Uncharacterized protein n=1 Tax=Choristoneura fumiferana TaxID=7141 RepID=A0ACC0K6N3_CHOFU|nr:hypothetical protein MSG28_004564 [Choristoneura fumiferana]
MEQTKRSCCSRETCCGIRVETGGFIFAIINAIIITGGTVCSMYFFGMMLSIRLDPEKMREQETNSAFLFFTIVISVAFVGAAIAEVFAVLLCVGISKKKPRYVMAYLVFGILAEIASLIGILIFIWMEWGEWDLVSYGAITLGVCAAYAVLLLLVKQTYIVLTEAKMRGHRKLINNKYDL